MSPANWKLWINEPPHGALAGPPQCGLNLFFNQKKRRPEHVTRMKNRQSLKNYPAAKIFDSFCVSLKIFLSKNFASSGPSSFFFLDSLYFIRESLGKWSHVYRTLDPFFCHVEFTGKTWRRSAPATFIENLWLRGWEGGGVKVHSKRFLSFPSRYIGRKFSLLSFKFPITATGKFLKSVRILGTNYNLSHFVEIPQCEMPIICDPLPRKNKEQMMIR